MLYVPEISTKHNIIKHSTRYSYYMSDIMHQHKTVYIPAEHRVRPRPNTYCRFQTLFISLQQQKPHSKCPSHSKTRHKTRYSSQTQYATISMSQTQLKIYRSKHSKTLQKKPSIHPTLRTLHSIHVHPNLGSEFENKLQN